MMLILAIFFAVSINAQLSLIFMVAKINLSPSHANHFYSLSTLENYNKELTALTVPCKKTYRYSQAVKIIRNVKHSRRKIR